MQLTHAAVNENAARVGIILSGGNIDADTLSRVLARQL